MRIHVGESHEPDLQGVDNFRALAVVAQGPRDPARLAVAVSSIGRAVGDDHVFLAPDTLPRLAEDRAHTSEWRSGYEQMVEYARDHGWVDDDGSIRAHVEWID